MDQVSTTSPQVVNNMTRDMKFVGIMTIIGGAIECLTIIGAIIGIPLIICGIRLREAADAFISYQDSNNADALMRGFERQGRYFFITKVIIIIGLCFAALYIFIMIIALIVSISQY